MTTTMETGKKEALRLLTELGGGNFGEDNIKREGTQLILPKNKSVLQCIEMLVEYQKKQEKVVPIVRNFRYRSHDGLIAFKRVIKQLTGMSAVTMDKMTFFGPQTPPAVQVEVGAGEFENAPTGLFNVELFDGVMELGTWHDEELGTLFTIKAEVPTKHTGAVEGFFKMIEEQLAEHSIYRGQPITAQDPAGFLDLSGVDPTKVVYSDFVMGELDAHVWSLLRHTEEMRQEDLPLKRTVLLHGPYGTGKTLAAYLTAQEAVRNGWTFIFVRPGKDSLNDAMATARLYQPAVLFFEDIDVTSDPDWDVSKLLDIFDGLQSKGNDLIGIFTTNFVDQIHKGLMRPGRMDAVIEINALDTNGIWKLLHSIVPPEQLADELDKERIGAAMEGFLPAFVKEAVDRARRYSMARNGGVIQVLTTQDFVESAEGLRPQLDIMNGAKDAPERESLTRELSKIVRKEIKEQYLVDGANGQLLVFHDRDEVPESFAPQLPKERV